MPDMVVSTAFKGKDFISKHFKRMGAQSKMFGNTATKSFNKASRSATKFGTITKGILAAGAVQRGLGLMQQGVGEVTRQFFSFDDAITGATARFKDIGPEAKDFNEQMRILRDRARLAGATTEQTATQAAHALDFLARAGFTSAEAMGSLSSMINLATASGEDFATVADFSSDLLGAFFGQIDNTAEKISKLNRLNDVLIKTSNSANVTIESQFETMKIAAPIARKYGAELEEVAALTALLGNSGIKGTLAATALKNAYTRLVKPTKEVRAGLGALGLTQADLIDKTGKMRKLTDVLSMITTRVDKLGLKGKAPELGIFAQIFGLRATAGAATLADSIKGIRDFEAMLKKAAGTSELTAERMRKSLGNRLKTLQSAAVESGFKFLEAFDKNIKGGIDGATKALRNFDMDPIIKSVKTAWAVFSGLYSVIRPFIPLMPFLIGGMIAYNAVLKAFIALEAIKTFFLFVRALRAAALAQGVLNTLMMLNPVGLVVIGVMALIVALVLLVKHWDKVKEVMQVTFDFWGPKIKTILNIMRPFIFLPLLMLENWKKVFKVLKVSFDFWLPKFEKIGRIAGFLERKKEAEITAPNKADVEARQRIDFTGRVDIAGAPKGSTVTSKTQGAPPVRMDLLGANHG